MMQNFKSKLVVTQGGTVTYVAPCVAALPAEAVYLVAVDTVIKHGDKFDGNVVTPDPDAAKKAALAAERKKAIAALQSADDKQTILDALAAATAAVQPLEDVVVP